MSTRVQYDIVINDLASHKLKQLGLQGQKSLAPLVTLSNKLNLSLNNTAKSADRLTLALHGIRDSGRSIDTITRKVRELNNELNQARRRSNRLDDSIDDIDYDKRTIRNRRRQRPFFWGARGGLGNAAVYANTFGMGRAAGVLGRGQSILGAASRGGMVGLPLLAGAAFYGYGATAGAGLQRQIANVAAVSQARGREDELRDSAIAASRNYAFKPTEAAEGLEFLARAGFKADEAMEILPSALALAQANVIDLGKSADIATNIITGFGIELEKFPTIVDILTQTTTAANVNLIELAGALKFAAPTAVTAGFNIKEVSAVIATLSQRGIKAGQAGRGLRTFFNVLTSEGKKANKELKELGVTLYNEDGTKNSLIEVIRQLEKVDPKKFGELFPANAKTVAEALTQAGSLKLEQFAGRLNYSAGLTNTIAGAQVDNLSGQVDILLGNLEAVAVKASEPLLAPLQRQVEELIKSLQNPTLESGLVRIAERFVSIGESISDIAGVLPSLNTSMSALDTTVGAVEDIFSIASKIIRAANKDKDREGVDEISMLSAIPKGLSSIAHWLGVLDDSIPDPDGRGTTAKPEGSNTRSLIPDDLRTRTGLFASEMNEEERAKFKKKDFSDKTTEDKKAKGDSVRGGIIINIDKLIEEQNINTTHLKESPAQIERMIEAAVIQAIRDVEMSYR